MSIALSTALSALFLSALTASPSHADECRDPAGSIGFKGLLSLSMLLEVTGAAPGTFETPLVDENKRPVWIEVQALLEEFSQECFDRLVKNPPRDADGLPMNHRKEVRVVYRLPGLHTGLEGSLIDHLDSATYVETGTLEVKYSSDEQSEPGVYLTFGIERCGLRSLVERFAWNITRKVTASGVFAESLPDSGEAWKKFHLLDRDPRIAFRILDIAYRPAKDAAYQERSRPLYRDKEVRDSFGRIVCARCGCPAFYSSGNMCCSGRCGRALLERVQYDVEYYDDETSPAIGEAITLGKASGQLRGCFDIFKTDHRSLTEYAKGCLTTEVTDFGAFEYGCTY